MEPVSTISAALTSTKAALEILSVAVSARDAAKIQAATLDLRERLFAMSDIAMSFIEKNAALVQENSTLKLAHTALENEHAKLKDEVRDAQNYALQELKTGALVLAYQPAVQGDKTPMHYLCAACKNEGRKSILQPFKHHLGILYLDCPNSSDHRVEAGTFEPARDMSPNTMGYNPVEGF